MNILLAIICISFSALFSSLTIGLMSLDLSTLRRKIKHGDRDAEKVYRIRKNGMLLLTTLLLGNAAGNSFFAILLGDMFQGITAGILSTVFLFLFAEILPQAAVSRFALSFGAKTAGLIRIMMWVLFPICYPIAWALNKLLGEEGPVRYTKRDILSIIEDDTTSEADVDQDEKRIARGAFSFSHRNVEHVMTPNTVVKMVKVDDVIDEKYLANLKDSGYSRLPVGTDDPNQFVGILYLKDLLGIELPKKVRDVMDGTIHFVNPSDPLDTVLNQFIKTKMHLFVVVDEFGGFEGVITVEDVIEEIIGAEIMDEDDVIPDLRQVAIHKKMRGQKGR
ncbi:MAG: CNNM domain-containing protein [Patescibacteria group bacterium]